MAINVTHSSMPPFEEYCEEIKSIWDTVHLTNMGPIHNKLKEELCGYLGVRNTELFVNGHLALYCVLKAMNVKGEIITTPFTFASTTNAIIQADCTPIFCDVKEDYTIDEEKIEELITDKTSAILGVHVYGNICNVEAIDRIAKKHNLKVIYDAAHAFGVEYKGKGICSYGDASMLSFHATKVYHTIEGGAICYNDDALSEKLSLQRSFGVKGDELLCFGSNAKMNEFSAAMGICNLRHIDEEIALRGEVFRLYCELLSGNVGVKLLEFNSDIKQNFAYFPVLFDKSMFGKNRDEVIACLGAEGINARKYFYPLVSENKEFGTDIKINTPKAKYYSENIVCLPLYAHLGTEDVKKICKIILK